MEATVKVIVQGTSLVLPLTRQLKSIGLKEGDWVKVTIEPIKVERIAPPVPDFDPTHIGDMILRTTEGISYDDMQLRRLIETYDHDSRHVESVVRYVREHQTDKKNRKKNRS